MYHPSDSDAYPGMKHIGETFGPEILLYFGTSLENWIQIAKLVRPKVTIVGYVEPSSLVQEFIA
jgi:hypothetical protein